MGINPLPPNGDFTEDDAFGKAKKEKRDETETKQKAQDAQNNESSPANGKKKKDSKKLSSSQNPLMALNEVKPSLEWTCSQTGNTPATNKFHMRTEIDGEMFEGQGVSKKLAKQAAAKSILNKLYKMNFTVAEMDTNEEMKVAGTDMVLSEFSEDQSVADNIGRLILEKYDELMVGHPSIVRRKVIAGIVMTLDKEMKKMVVLCVSTGTKCISGEYMSVSGTGLNDCHAEIISRRCLMDYLYTQLERVNRFDHFMSIVICSVCSGFESRGGPRG